MGENLVSESIKGERSMSQGFVAQYAAEVTYSATRYDMWQYTSKGSVSGISGNVDLNICY